MRLKKGQRTLLIHFCVLLFFLAVILFYRCPFSYFFNVNCPGCGITRACLAAARLDFHAAWAYHPLFFLVGPTILYAAHRNLLPRRLNAKVESILYFSIIASFLIVYIVKCFKQ